MPLASTTSIRDLGVIFDATFRFNALIANIAKRVIRDSVIETVGTSIPTL